MGSIKLLITRRSFTRKQRRDRCWTKAKDYFKSKMGIPLPFHRRQFIEKTMEEKGYDDNTRNLLLKGYYNNMGFFKSLLIKTRVISFPILFIPFIAFLPEPGENPSFIQNTVFLSMLFSPIFILGLAEKLLTDKAENEFKNWYSKKP